MRRAARALAVMAAAFLFATPIHAPPPPDSGEPAVARLFAEPVPLNPEAPEQNMLGPLRYLGGWVLRSDDRRFGAFSALAVDGADLLALSDEGHLLRFPASLTGTVAIDPIARSRRDPASKYHRDIEAMAVDGGQLWVAFENTNEVWRYDLRSLRQVVGARPPAMRRWSANRGAEALARLPDGRFLAVREDVDDGGVSEALIFSGDPAEPTTSTEPLRIDPPDRERITDAAALPDGRLLMITRRFSLWSGFTGHLLLSDRAPVPGGLMPTRVIAAIAAPITRDNMEAIAVSQENGRTMVWLASDDNLSSFQRTLLMKFEWTESVIVPDERLR